MTKMVDSNFQSAFFVFFAMRIYLVLLPAIIGLIASAITPSQKPQGPIFGACLVNPPAPIKSADLAALKEVNAEWVAVIPYGFSRAGLPGVSYDHSQQWWGERTKGNCMMIKYAKENGLKVMCKPHVWVRGQGWVLICCFRILELGLM